MNTNFADGISTIDFGARIRLGMQQISDVLIIVDENMEYVNGCFILDDGDDYSLEKFKKL